MKALNKSVLVHSCHPKDELIPKDLLVPNERYVGETNIEKQVWFRPFPKSCRCRRYITLYEADEQVGCGQAIWVLKIKRGAVIPDESQVWMPIVREKVPRIDLITKADIERCYIGSERKSKHYVFNKSKKKFVVIRTIPEGMTKKEWDEDAQEEINFERRFRKQFKEYIEGCHAVTMEARAKLIVPFKPDPFDGRTLFFTPDERTAGGRVSSI
jgi:hypothetical protein